MKRPNDILHNIFNGKPFNNFKKYRSLNQIKNLFTSPLRDNILFIYEKNSILFFLLPIGLKMEFNYRVNSIKNELKIYMKKHFDINLVDIKVLIKKYDKKSKLFRFNSEQYYQERSKGAFLIIVVTKILRIFLKILENYA